MWNNEQGEFVRYSVNFRNWVKADGSTPFQPEPGRYHLYVSLACPWSHRAVILRTLKGLEDAISMSVTGPVWNRNGWWFPDDEGVIPETVNHKRDLVEIYRLADPNFKDEETVPVLWDKKTGRLVNNESREIIRMFDLEFDSIAKNKVNLYPKQKAEEIDRVIDQIYEPINNGVYRCGFATKQRAYEKAFDELFAALDHWEMVLGQQRYLCGDTLTEADVCMFVTLLRFDPVYYGHFKCNLRRIVDYPNLWAYVRDIYQTPGVAETCNFDHIKRHYYGSHKEINPTGIVPKGPEIDFSIPHDRGR